MSQLVQGRDSVRFGPFELDLETRELYKNDKLLKKLGNQPYKILVALIDKYLTAGSRSVLTRKELVVLLWANGQEPWDGLKKAVKALRRALEDDPNIPRYIQTVEEIGYRFITPIEKIPVQDRQPRSESNPTKPEPAEQELDSIGTAEERELPEIDESEIVGRTSEVDRICDSLLARKGRVLSLLGEGGVGKTTIALIIRQRLKAEFRGGVWFVKLSGFNSPDRLASYIACLKALPFAVGEQFTNENTDPREEIEKLAEKALINHFQSRERLLILDNCEHLRAAVGTLLTKLITECPDLHVLTTSRRSLELLVIEDPIVVPALAHSVGAHAAAKDVLALPSIQLFLRGSGLSEESAKVLGKDFIAKLRELSMLLEGIPLCIVLAAARYRRNPNIDAILTDVLRTLSIQDPTMEPKAKAVRASIEWSQQLLSPTAGELFHRLSVFYGGWDNSALLEVCGGIARDNAQILDAQMELEDYFLIISAHGGRHRMNSVIREFAFERLKSGGKSDDTLRAHAKYYAKLGGREGPKVLERDMKRAAALLTTESENFNRAFDWCRTNDVTLGLRLATGLWHFWVAMGFFSYGRSTVQEFLSNSDNAAPTLICRALAGLATLAYFQSDYRSALDLAQRCLLQARKTRDTWAQVIVLVIASIAEVYQPNPDRKPPGPIVRSLRYLDKSVDLADGRLSAYWLQALAHSNRAFMRAQIDPQKRRRWEKLLAEAGSAVASARRSQNEWIIDVALVNEAFTIWYAHPNPDRAEVERLLQTALKSRHDIGDRYGILQIFGLLAHVICTAKNTGEQDYRRAAILLGIQDAMQDQKELPIPALNNKAINDARNVLRTKLPSEIDRLWAHARERMSQTDALQFALGELDLDWRSIT
jgi:non-specific serine/threonine protein kinase